MISVVTPTTRPEGLELVEKALKRQTYKEWEWIVSAPVYVKVKGFKIDQLLSDPPKEPLDVWSLNKAYNKMLRHAHGELIVSWQDFTFADPDALEKFWWHYQANSKFVVSGVGNKYTDATWSTQTWQDPRERKDQGAFYECFPQDIEGNFAALPKGAFYEAGGFDEEMDQMFGLDFYDVMLRIDKLGKYKFYLDQTNKSYSLEHKRPERWQELNWITDGRYQKYARRRNKIRLDYLV